jgi:tetratricopeptide (TPR) repeat protein
MDPTRPQQAVSSNLAFDDGGGNNPLTPKPLFEIALDQLIKDGNSDEWTLLQYLAWLNHEFTSEELLLEVLNNDQGKLRKAIENLEKLSFVSVISKGEVKGFTIPSEIQDQVVNYATNNPNVSKKASQVLEDISELLNKYLPKIKGASDEQWGLAKTYVVTVEAMFEHSANRELRLPENREVALLNIKLGKAYERMFVDAKKSLAYKEKALAIYQALYEGNQQDVAWSLSNVGNAYGALGDLKKGLVYQEKSLAMYQALYGEHNYNVAGLLYNIGVTYQNLGGVKKGLSYYERALTIYQALYEENHRNVAVALNAIGVAYENLGDAKECLNYYWRALTMYQALYEGNHHDVAMSLNNVGAAYEALGDVEQGLNYYERGLTMYQALHEGNNPDMAMSLNNVGSAYETLGNIKKGLVYQEKALSMYQAIYEGNHPDVAKSLNNVGFAYEALGDIEKGLEYYKKALTMYQALYEGDHPNVAISLNNVGFAYEKLGDVKNGLIYKEAALAMKQALYDITHPDVAGSLSNVGLSYGALGDIGKRDLYKSCASSNNGFINKRGPITKSIIRVKQKLQSEVLNAIQDLAAKGEWSRRYASHYDWGVLGYIDKSYLKKQLHKLNNAGNVKIALSLCFEAITIGIANSEGRDPTCAIEFARAYPELVSEIVKEHPEYFVLETIARACLADAEYSLVVAPAASKEEQEAKEEFKGNGMLSYSAKSYYEYYNTALDGLLKLRLGVVSPQIKRLASCYLDGTMAYLDVLASKVSDEFSNDIELILVPANLQGKHWLGLAFRKSGNTVEVIYMDPEQRPAPSLLKLELENSLSINGYKTHFLELRLERQRYNSCGPELIENFVYYLTGTRATQEAAIYVHSLLLENSLLDLEEYGLKIEENNKLIEFLSNAAPIPIRSMDVFPRIETLLPHASSQRKLGSRPNPSGGWDPGITRKAGSSGQARGLSLDPSFRWDDAGVGMSAKGGLPAPRSSESVVGPRASNKDELALNLLPAIEQFNIFSAKWVQDKLQQINSGIYKTTLGFKGLDLLVDSARLAYEPEIDNAKKVAHDASQLYGMVVGVNGYSAFVSGAEVAYLLQLGEYQKACDVAIGTVSAMALPAILAMANRPYLGFVYSVWMAASTAYNAVENAYSFALELSNEEGFEVMSGQVKDNFAST